MSTILLFVRHAEVHNPRDVVYGRLPRFRLSARGREQAARVAACLAGVPLAAIYTSPLLRARQTAAAFGRPVEVDQRWIEMDYGELDGTPVTDVAADVWERWRADASFVPAGGESLAAVGRRVREACAELLEEARVADVVVVTHVSPIKAAVAWALGSGDEVAWRMFVEDASVARIAVGPAGPLLMGFNQSPLDRERPG